ncbi:hypothetical protein [Macrococcus animalis]|uniref:hypothetical protein n=1 Tax=Macrococcus animalis TaxID=3395467 RepID=UPI0039BE62B2
MERYITVNKEVFVSDKYIKANKGDDVLNISDLNETDGFTQFVLIFYGWQSCCEIFGFDIVGESPFGKSLFVREIKIEELNEYGNEDFSDLNAGGAVSITLITPNQNYEIIYYNAHNGYYAHSLEMKHLENGEIQFNYDDCL